MIGNSEQLRGFRILVLNWRDVRHPLAGGAEQYMHEIGSRWVRSGAHVTWLTAAVPGEPEHERLDGMHILRAGGELTVYPRTALRGSVARGHFDAVVDCQNGTPFFAPLFAGRRTPVVQLVHHVHQDQFGTHFPAPVAALGRWLEGPAARRVYGDRPVVAVSPSTRHELRDRLGWRGPIFVVPNGTVELPPAGIRRAAEPTIALVSRLVPHKRIDLLLGHLRTVAESIPGLRVDIVGDGPDRARLESLADELGMQATVTFHGRASDEVRDELLSRAWLTTSTSQAEGWGCSVLEAAAWGVPCLALRVPGVRDSVLDGETGWLVDEPRQLGAALTDALRCLADPVRADQIAETCRTWAGCFSWDRSADLLAGVVRAEIARMAAVTDGRPVQSRTARSDIAVLAVVPRRAPELRARLRATDEVIHSEDRTAVVLNGCDETTGVAVMTRLGERPISVQLMDNRLILAGPTAPLAPEGELGQLGLHSA
ncbi:Glycosyltransferase involved in cell wall bisynthesis [Blastococcus aurantiacus]|uniref:Glycosyltransferase involved in cell wall bisynthesis n=1 Tax=Blastococcus aurantiacus TaxID=1550231 RepID=A0A1G7LTM0_9ACTN|nr:glycosyltransferase family 4 protein [Blastococcus aurantiacus]SDF52793.1 Glycosyltransferase involved in cell wall bisynthesis [Blastococcus aurantiacus]